MSDPTPEIDGIWERVAALPVLRLRTMQVVAGKGPDTYENCVRVADLRAAGLLPPLPPPTCCEKDCGAPRTVPEVSPIWCEAHRDAVYAKQRAARLRRNPRYRPVEPTPNIADTCCGECPGDTCYVDGVTHA